VVDPDQRTTTACLHPHRRQLAARCPSDNGHEKATEAGCDDYDTKPIELPRLLEKIERLLRTAAAGSP
jgi:DNA-binding response OmpR family regulator